MKYHIFILLLLVLYLVCDNTPLIEGYQQELLNTFTIKQREDLEAIKKHLSDLSEIVYNLHEQNPQWAQALQALVVNRDEMYQVIKVIDVAKDRLEDFMGEFSLLPEDYDNGLI